jgi:cell division protein FtsB
MINKRSQGLNKRERKLLNRVILGAVIFAILFLLFAPGRGIIPYRNLKNKVQVLNTENKTLQQRNMELAQEIERLKNDDAYLEQLARGKQNLLKKNEEVYYYGKKN